MKITDPTSQVSGVPGTLSGVPLTEALHAAGVKMVADNGYRGAVFALPQRRRPVDPQTGHPHRVCGE